MTYYDEIQQAAAFLRARISGTPSVAMILGSGLGDLATRIAEPVVIPYADIPGFPHSQVPGHADQLVFGTLAGRAVAAMQGRFHYYEGFTMKQLAFPVFVLRALGCGDLIITNACGAINEAFAPGDLMLIADHINLWGKNPLIGENDERLGPRFPDMTEVYTRSLRALALETARALDIPLKEGVYAYFSGPCFETAAEIRAFKALGADAVGMSTVPEATAARYLGMRVLGLACVTNMATGIAKKEHSHLDVLAVANAAGEKLSLLVERTLRLGTAKGKFHDPEDFDAYDAEVEDLLMGGG